MELEGRVATVIGGTRGIGRACAEAFLAEGANVVINGRSEEKGQRALEEIGLSDDRVAFISGDACEKGDVEAVIDGTVEKFGKIDILMANAGGGSDYAPVVDLTDEAMEFALTVNFWHTFWAMRRALKYMIPQESGRIITMSSVEGKYGKPVISPYVAAKHAVNGLTKSCAQEVGTLGITVNAVCPGAISTEIILVAGPAAAVAPGMTYE
jgi:3-hydroxybutyrate dehydrogenase